MPVDFHHTTLDNGLTIIAEVNPEAHTSAAGFFINVGTRDESADIMGVSHFLEHMMFKGTARRTAEEVNRDFDAIGANYNAFTSQELTAYFAHVLPEHLNSAIDILADIMRPTLRGEDFEMEKNVILEEIGMYQDRPFWVIHERSMQRYFGEHPLGYRVLGTDRTINQLQRDAMADYFAHRYSPDNMVVALAGAFEFDACVEQLGAMCGDWAATGARREHGDAQPHPCDESHEDAKLTNHYVTAVTPAPDRADERRYAAYALAHVLGDAEGSRLYWKLVDTALADEADLSFQPFDRTGTFMAFASCAPRHAAAVEAGLFEVLDTAGEGLTDAEVERAKNKLAVDLTLQHERPAGRMIALGGHWLCTGEYRTLGQELDHLMAVGADDLRALVEQFPFSRRAVVRCSPPRSGRMKVEK